MDLETNKAVAIAAGPLSQDSAGRDETRLPHPLAWYRALSGNGRASFFSCFAGVTLDAMDMRIFTFLMPTLAAAWGASKGQIGFVFSAAMITAAIGGWGSGLLSDRFGRVRVLQLTILVYSVFTFLSGFAQNYGQLMICRCLQGLGYGGEITAGIVLMAEAVPARFRGTAVGCLQSGFAVGWALAAVVSGVFLSVLPPDWGWRVTFWTGLAPAALVLVLRRAIKEPPHRRESHGGALAAFRQIGSIFTGRVAPTTILTSLVASGAQGSAIATSTWLPTYLETSLHLSHASVSLQIVIVTLGSLFGYLTGAYFSDVLGRKAMFVIYTAGSVMVLATYLFGSVAPGLLLVLALFVGFFSQGIYSILGSFVAELFPTGARANGTSFAYGIGRFGAAASVALVGVAAHGLGLRVALYSVLVVNFLLTLLPLLMLRETRAMELED